MRRLVLALVLLASSSASAGSFRGGTVAWRINSAPRTVTLTVTTVWDEPTTDDTSVALDFGDGAPPETLTPQTFYTGATAAHGEGFTVRRATVTHTYAADGQYTAAITGCCRHPTANALGTDPFRVEAGVVLGTGEYGSPALLVVDPQLPVDAVSPSTVAVEGMTPSGGSVVTAALAPAAVLAPPTGASVAIVGGRAQIAWTPGAATLGASYTVSVVARDSGAGSSMLEAVVETVAAGGVPPSCVPSPALLDVPAGVGATVSIHASSAPVLVAPATATLSHMGQSDLYELHWAPSLGDVGSYELAYLRLDDATSGRSFGCAFGARATHRYCHDHPLTCGHTADCIATLTGSECRCQVGWTATDDPLSCPDTCALIPLGGNGTSEWCCMSSSGDVSCTFNPSGGQDPPPGGGSDSGSNSDIAHDPGSGCDAGTGAAGMLAALLALACVPRRRT